MKKNIFTCLTLIIQSYCFAQFGEQQIITVNASLAYSVFSEDLDGDGDMDVLSASQGDEKIAWYENLDGLGNFGEQEIISTNIPGTRDVYAADLDGNEDMDVLAVSTASDEVLWFENTNGQGDFGTAQIITAIADGVLSVYAADIDGDEDMDVLSAEFGDDTIAWFENTDGMGNFGVEQIITTNAISAKSVFATDLDNDGDMDVLSASANNTDISWYENTNSEGTFGPQQNITTDVEGARDAYASDLDGDGDMDVLSASSADNKIAWYKNQTYLGTSDYLASKINLYPNPASTVLYINNNDIEINKIEIYDVLGNKVWVQIGTTKQIDISNLAMGLYLVNIQTNQGVLVKKMVKE